jgi:hypothetical protein
VKSEFNVFKVICSIVLNQPLPRDEVQDELDSDQVLEQVFDPVEAEDNHGNDHQTYENGKHDDILALLPGEVSDYTILEGLQECAVHPIQVLGLHHDGHEELLLLIEFEQGLRKIIALHSVPELNGALQDSLHD